MSEAAGLLGRVADRVDRVLWPAAQAVDQAELLPWGHVQALADLGLLGQAVPADQGGLGLAPPEVRRVMRLIGSGCGATGFAFAQHHGVAAALARTANTELRDRWLGPLCRDTLAGIAFAHLRRPGPPVVAAEPVPGGWRVTGEAPWATSWGLAQVFLVAAGTPDDQVVWFLVPGRASAAMAASEPLRLAVMGATGTVRLRFHGLIVPDADVVEVVPRAGWVVGDRRAAARPNPLCLGIGDRALRLLAELDPALAEHLAPGWARVGEQSEAAARAVDAHTDDIAAVAAARATSIGAVQRLTTARLAAGGGRGAELGHPAQRLAREALFYVVQAQSADGRAATLAALAAEPTPDPAPHPAPDPAAG